MKVKLTYVNNEDKVSKNGKPYTRCSIKTEGTGDEWINGFGNETTKTWNPGDEVEVRLFDEEYEGKTYKKFEAPKPAAAALAGIEELRKQLAALEARVADLELPKNPASKEGFDEFLGDDAKETN